MPDADGVIEVLREWVSKADHDLNTAVLTLKQVESRATEVTCFHAQQCVEKYLKALLVMLLIDFPKTHNIPEILAYLPERMRPEMSVSDQRKLTDFAVLFRYPRSPDPTFAEARTAVALARRVRAEVRRKLPKAALRRPKVRWK